MDCKAFVPDGQTPPPSQIGATFEALASTIAARRGTGSYTDSLLSGSVDGPLKKLMEEASEVALAAKDVEGWATAAIASAVTLGAQAEEPANDSAIPETLSIALPPEYQQAVNHFRYEAADVVYHLLVVLERYGMRIDELAAELNARMTESERPEGAILLKESDIERGK